MDIQSTAETAKSHSRPDDYDKQYMESDMLVLVVCLMAVLRHLSREFTESQEKLRTWSQYLDRISNWIPTKYECRGLPLHQSALSVVLD